MKLLVVARLARVSNLPTVWSNVLVGAAFCGAEVSWSLTCLVALGVSALYCGGMFLNDAFDHVWDRKHRAERPIPQGLAQPDEVMRWGGALMLTGLAICVAAGGLAGLDVPRVGVWATLLVGLIVAYDRWHHENRGAWCLMGACRGAVYLLAAASLGAHFERGIALAAVVLWAYVGGLTHVACFEAREGRAAKWAKWALWGPWIVYVPRLGLSLGLGVAVVGALWVRHTLSSLLARRSTVGASVGSLICAMPFVDAMILVSVGEHARAGVALCMVALCARWQRRISGV
ncbi:MAG: UbiA family prenyltransferase [Nannocystaceae bacterium]